MATTTGQCLCGAAKFHFDEAVETVSVCHCTFCRRWNTGPMMAVHPEAEVVIDQGETVVWYRSSDWAERGFCSTCGTSLFWRMADGTGGVVVGAGALDGIEGARLSNHIFIDEKARYYDFKDDAPRLTAAETIALFTGGGESE